LITGIILKDTQNGRFSIADFYRRRIKRIFPALFVVLFCCFVAGYAFLTPSEFRELGRTMFSTILFVSNIDFWQLTGYFDGAAELKPLLHTWSLAVEEQFYIFFPPFLYLIWTKARRQTPWILLALFVASLVFAEVLRQQSPSAAYFLAPARGFELLTGALLATGFIRPSNRQAVVDGLSVLGLACIALPLFLYSRDTPFPGITALLPCLGTAAVIHAGQSLRSRGGEWISSAPFQYLGGLSYSLYLWHWPVLAFARNLWGAELSGVQAGGAVSVALAMAIVSHRFVEQPFLHRGDHRTPYLRGGFAVVAVVCSVALATYLANGLPGRFNPQAQAMFASANDFNHQRARCHNGTGAPLPYAKNCVYGAPGITPDTAVWADSHGAELVVALGYRAEAVGRSVMQITASACPPALDYAIPGRPHCRQYNRDTLQALIDDRNLATVILAVNASAYPEPQALYKGFEGTVRALTEAHKRVILSLEIPIMNAVPPAQAGRTVQARGDLGKLGLPRNVYDTQNAEWRAVAQRLRDRFGATLFDPAVALCNSDHCRMVDPAAGVLYFNQNHLSVAGAVLLSRTLADDLYGVEFTSAR
jgi:peptidoglycan/LPS O-acetylase OafA/YrhL